MKRTLYLLLLCLSGWYPVRAQVIFSEQFENFQQGYFSYPWLVTGNSGSFPWKPDVYYFIGSLCFPYVNDITKVAGISDIMNMGGPCAGDHNDSNVLLCTPYISLTGVTNAWVQFDSWFTKKTVNGQQEQATVEISTDSGHNWTVLGAPPVVSGSRMARAYFSLAAYANMPAVRLGFRYSDGGGHMTGWMIDNLKVLVPPASDLALAEATPADSMRNYVLPNTPVPLGGTVFNGGTQPVTSFTVSYRANNGPVSAQTISGVNIPPFQSYTFQLANPFTVPGIDRYELRLWVSVPGDANPVNDSGRVSIHGVPFFPDKQVVIEHGSGTWYPFAPQGYVLLQQIKVSDFPAALIALHDQDPMFLDTAYTKYVEHMQSNYVPYFFYDRRNKVEAEVVAGLPPSTGPLVGVYSIFDPAAVLAQFDRQRQYFGFASLVLHPTVTGNTLQLEVRLTPATDLLGIHRLALVFAEDQVQGTDPGYSQQNAYANNLFGTMGGYESLPQQVPAGSMTYDFVGRKAVPAPEGAAGSLPLNLYTNNQYTYTFQTTIPASWNRKKLKAHVLLIRDADSTILNSATVGIPALGIDEPQTAARFASVYPNPADQSVNLLLYLRSDATVTLTATDITGRVIWQSERGRMAAGDYNIPFRTDQWANGMYLLQVQAGQRRQTLKVDVVH